MQSVSSKFWTRVAVSISPRADLILISEKNYVPKKQV